MPALTQLPVNVLWDVDLWACGPRAGRSNVKELQLLVIMRGTKIAAAHGLMLMRMSLSAQPHSHVPHLPGEESQLNTSFGALKRTSARPWHEVVHEYMPNLSTPLILVRTEPRAGRDEQADAEVTEFPTLSLLTTLRAVMWCCVN